MQKERDWRPWILGGVSTAAVAIAIAAVSSRTSTVPAPLPSTPAVTAPAVATPIADAVAKAQPDPGAPPPAATVSAPATADSGPSDSPESPAGQIWACTTNGVKTYSNNPCGEHSSLLEVGPINTMSAATPARYAPAYPAQPQYLPPYNDPRSQSYADEDSDEGGYDNDANTYTVVQGVAVLPRRRPERHRRGPPYHHAAAPEHRAAVPDHHPSAPAPRKF